MKKIVCVAVMAAVILGGCGTTGSADNTSSGSSASASVTENSSKASDSESENANESVLSSSEPALEPNGDYRIALITMDSIDQHWIDLNSGAQAEAEKDGVTVDFMSPDTKDDSKQIECVNNATAGGYDAIMVAANGPDAISRALQNAVDSGIKLIYIDSPATVEAEATFSTDNEAAGKIAGEQMIENLQADGITEGDIGVVNVNASTQSCVKREEGFRSAFEGTDYDLLETQYCDGDAAKAQSIAENYITQGVVGIFGTNEGSATGIGNAIKASGDDSITGIGFDKTDSIKNLIEDGYLYCTIAQRPEKMGSEGVRACIRALNGEDLGGETVDTGVDVLKKGDF